MTDPKEYFLGFDGGATKTSGAIVNSNGEVLSERTGGPSNFQILGIPRASGNIVEVAKMVLEASALQFSDVSGIFLGLTGAGREVDQVRMKEGFEEYLRENGLPVPRIAVESDALAALEGAFPGKAGMILISGTGSILLAKDDSGKVIRTGGWGRFIGDEGSGYFIGKAGLTAYVKEYDGRGKKTKISELLRNLDIQSPQSLVLKIYHENFDIASVAKIVVEAAYHGDEVASSILEDAAVALMTHIRAAVSKIGTEIPLALMGSILSHKNLLVTKLTNLISRELPAVKVCHPEKSAAAGAALLARRGIRATKGATEI
jgi:N-acetylglucosamine kinase-like BadF-type ATPase